MVQVAIYQYRFCESPVCSTGMYMYRIKYTYSMLVYAVLVTVSLMIIVMLVIIDSIIGVSISVSIMMYISTTN